jgi:hypothetical protein
MTGGLNNENVLHTDIVMDFDLNFPVGEGRELGPPQGHIQILTDSTGQIRI